MTDQRIAVFDKADGRAVFTTKSASIPKPGPGEVRFKVSAFAINQADIVLAEGKFGMGLPLPIRIGYEASGVVDAIGPGVTRFNVGDPVSSLPCTEGPTSRYLTGAEYALAQEDFLSEWPAGWSAEQAASLWMQYLTPYFPFVELFPVSKGDWVIITAATGGTGLGSVRLAAMLGARVIATSRSPHKEAVLREHGAEVVLSADRDDFIDEVMRITGNGGVSVINDSLCGAYVEPLSRTLAFRGKMYVHGALSGRIDFNVNALGLMQRQASISGFSLQNEMRQPGGAHRGRSFVVDAIRRGALPPPHIDGIYPLAQLQDACDRMRSGKQLGKIVVRVD